MQMTVNIYSAVEREPFVKLVVWAVAVRFDYRVSGLVCEKDVVHHKYVGARLEALVDPPTTRLLAVVIPSHQPFDAWQASQDILDLALRTDQKVSAVDYQVVFFDRLNPVSLNFLGEIQRTLAKVGSELQVIKVRVGYDVCAHCCKVTACHSLT